MLNKDKLSFDLDFGQDGSSLESDSVLIGGSEHNLEGAKRGLFRQDKSLRMVMSGPLAPGSDAELADKTLAAAPTGAVRASNVATFTSTIAHGYSIGDEIEVSGVTDNSFDGFYVVESVPTTTTFTVSNSGADTTSGTGNVENFTRNPWPLMLGAVNASNQIQNLQVNGSGELLVSATTTSNTEYAEDSAHTTADLGNFILAVRNDVEGSMVNADGDYSPLQVDSVGRLRVIADLDVTNLAEKAEDSAHGSGDIGNYILSVREDIPIASTSADGDYQSLKTDGVGNLWVKHNGDINIADGGNSITVDGTFWQATQPVSNAGVFVIQEDGAALTALQLIDDIVLLEDAAAAGGEAGVQTLAVRQDTLANSVSADGDFGSLKLDSLGRLYTSAEIAGQVADDAADSGNPLKIGARAVEPLDAVVASNDRVDLITDLRRRLYVVDMPNISTVSAAVSVGTSEVALPTTALSERTRMFIQNNGNKALYVGPTGVTTATGMKISAGATLTLEIGDQIALYGISTNAGQDIRVFEMA